MRKRDTKRIYAMKVIRKACITTPDALAQVIAERQVLAKVRVHAHFSLASPRFVGGR